MDGKSSRGGGTTGSGERGDGGFSEAESGLFQALPANCCPILPPRRMILGRPSYSSTAMENEASSFLGDTLIGDSRIKSRKQFPWDSTWYYRKTAMGMSTRCSKGPLWSRSVDLSETEGYKAGEGIRKTEWHPCTHVSSGPIMLMSSQDSQMTAVCMQKPLRFLGCSAHIILHFHTVPVERQA